MSATARPWAVEHNRPARVIKPGKAGFDGKPYRVLDAYESSALADTPRHAEAVANAALIVRAVNAHDELVAALKAIFEHPNDVTGAYDMVRIAQAALIKAGALDSERFK